jgi:tetratricopeptide (TPR) repeat protein
LEKAVQRNPRHAEAQFLLGVAYASQNKHADAVRHIELAAAVLPRQSYFWHALASSYQALGRKQEAIHAARRALDAASTTEQAQMAHAAIRSLATPPAAEPPKRPAVVTPDSWKNKQGDAKLQGILERIECLGQSARFHVRAQNKTHALLVENPGDVLLRNASSMTFEFRCGPQKPLPIALDYFSSSGIVTAIEFP